jgi:hypothetical protein
MPRLAFLVVPWLMICGTTASLVNGRQSRTGRPEATAGLVCSRDVVIATLPPDVGYWLIKVSPGCNRVAVPEASTNNWWVSSEDGTETVLQDVDSSKLWFSPDGNRFAYVARNGKKRHAVVDGRLGPPFEDVRDLGFSSDGSLTAYSAKSHKQWSIVVNHRAGPLFDAINDSCEFSRSGRHYAYAAFRSGQAWVVHDGRLFGPFADLGADARISAGCPVILSDDGKHFACVVKLDGVERVLVDGVLRDAFSRIHYPLVFSPDGARFAYSAEREEQALLVVDGHANPIANEVLSVQFSPNARRIACIVRNGQRARAIVDGVHGPEFDSIRDLIFSPDNRRVAYTAKRDGRYLEVIDGVPQEAFGEDPFGVWFSPDSKRYAYFGRRNDRDFAVIDGKEIPAPHGELDLLAWFRFTKDSRHFIYGAYAAESRDNDRTVASSILLVDGKPCGTYHWIQDSIRLSGARGFEFVYVHDGQIRHATFDWGTVTSGHQSDSGGCGATR